MGRVHAQKLFAYWLTSVGSLAMQYSFSVIFVDLLVAFDSTRAATAAVGSLSAGLMDGFGVISGRAIARRLAKVRWPRVGVRARTHAPCACLGPLGPNLVTEKISRPEAV